MRSTFGGSASGSTLITLARTLVRGADERKKPDETRLREFTDTNLPRIAKSLQAPDPINLGLEEMRLSLSLRTMREWLGADHPFVRKALGKESPESLAHTLVTGSKLGDATVRMALWNGGFDAVEASDDPMIRFARLIDPESRAIRRRVETEVEAPEESAKQKIAEARFAFLGTSVYPDATSTLRLNYGVVRGWVKQGHPVEPFTYMDGLFDRVTGQPPYAIPQAWLDAKAVLDPKTPFNFTTDNDIVGGNSGSPVIDRDGNLVGLAFDGNMESIGGSYWFDDASNRMVAVHPAIMMEALRKVYHLDRIVRELRGEGHR